MKIIVSSGLRAAGQKKIRKIQLPAIKNIPELIPINLWLIITVLLPALISIALIFQTSDSLENIGEFYFEALLTGAVLSIPILVFCCIMYWCLLKINISVHFSRVLFLFILVAGMLAEIVFFQNEQLFGLELSDTSFFVATIAIILPGVAHAFRLNS